MAWGREEFKAELAWGLEELKRQNPGIAALFLRKQDELGRLEDELERRSAVGLAKRTLAECAGRKQEFYSRLGQAQVDGDKIGAGKIANEEMKSANEESKPAEAE
jgi:hypothetical protein